MALAKPGRISIGDVVEIEYKQSAFWNNSSINIYHFKISIDL